MKQILLQFLAVTLLLFTSIGANAQRIAINNSGMEADTSAMLDIASTTTGMLIPRMLQSQRTAIVLPATGLLVYQTDNTSGFYYYDGAQWQLISSGIGWGITGNSNTSCTTNFIGTTNGTDVVFKSNSSENMRISNTTGNLVLGSGDGTGTVTGNTLRAPNGSGTNIAGANLTITPGNGTGTGGSGNLIFQTASIGSTGGTANTMTERLRVTNTGAIAIGGASNYGTSGNVIQSGGNGSPSWGALTLSNTNSVTGTLGIGNGGTGATTLTSNGIVYGNGTSAIGATAAGTTGQVLTVNGSNVPVWTTATFPATTTANQILYSSATNTVTGLATANNGVLITGAMGVPSIGTTLPAAVQGNITSVGTISSGTWNGTTIAVANGGTGAATLTSNGVVYGNGTSTVGVTAAGSQGQHLTINASGVPVWTTATYPSTTTANQLLYSSSTNTVTGLPIGANSQVLTVVSGVPTWVTPASLAWHTTNITNNTASGFVQIALPSGSVTSGEIEAVVTASNATDNEVTSESVHWVSVNKGGTYSSSINNEGDSEQKTASNGGGTGASFTITPGTNVITINVNFNSNLSSITTETISYIIMEGTGKTITEL